MSDYEKLGIGQAVNALSIRMTDMQRQLSALRQDVRKVLFLLENQRVEAQIGNELDLEDVKSKSDVQI